MHNRRNPDKIKNALGQNRIRSGQGASIYDVYKEVGRGSENTPILQTKQYLNLQTEGGGGQKSNIFVDVIHGSSLTLSAKGKQVQDGFSGTCTPCLHPTHPRPRSEDEVPKVRPKYGNHVREGER